MSKLQKINKTQWYMCSNPW